MNCDTASQQISGWIDRELSPAEAAALEEHLAVCGECQSLAEGLRAQDADLRKAFEQHRQAAARVADKVLQSLPEKPLAVRPRSLATPLEWGRLVVAAAAGFLLAVVLFQP